MGRKIEAGVDNMAQWWGRDTNKQFEKRVESNLNH
jgi:hypothetical protein